MPYKKYEDSVDQILENLKQSPASSNDRAVDHILADLGFDGVQPKSDGVDDCAPCKPADSHKEQTGTKEATARRTIRRADPKTHTAAQTSPCVKQETAADLDKHAAQTAVQQDNSVEAPSFQLSESLHINELIDDEFTRFFSESVAVMPDDDKENGRGHSLFHRFRRKHKAEQEPVDYHDEILPASDEKSQPQSNTGSIQLDLNPAQQPQSAVQDHAVLLDLGQQDTAYDPEEPDACDQDDAYDEEAGNAKRSRFSLRLFGNREDEQTYPDSEETENEKEWPASPFEDEEEEPVLEDYDTPEDAPAVQADLAGMHAGWGVRTALAAILSLALLYLGLTASQILPAIQAIDPQQAPVPYLAVNLIFLLAGMALSWDVLRDGFVGLIGCPSGQTMPTLAAVGAAVQLIVLMVKKQSYAPDQVTLFAAPASLLLCMALLGRAVMAGVVERNFQLVTRKMDYAASYLVQSRELTEKVAQGLGEEDPQLLVSRPTTLVKGFLSQSFSQAPSDRLAQKLSWVLLAAALITGSISIFQSHDVVMAVSVLAGTLALGGPLCSTLLAAVPCLMMQKSAARVGAVVPGWSAVEELGDANMVMVNAQDLFPKRSVLLHGIKTFEKERIDLAILYAASILVQASETLQDVFMNIIQGKTDMLYQVENLTCEIGYGFTGWIENNRVIVGNRGMMEKHDIELPSMDYEERYTKKVRQPIYLAVSGKLFGMFVVSYHADRQVSGVLENLHHAGISVLVKSDDFSVTGELVESVYNLPQGSVKVLSQQDRKDLAPATAYLPQSEGCLTHIGTFASMVGGLQAAEGAAGAERTASLVQAVGIGLSCALALLLAITGGLVGLALPAVVLYQAAWSALVLAMPLIKKY